MPKMVFIIGGVAIAAGVLMMRIGSGKNDRMWLFMTGLMTLTGGFALMFIASLKS